MMVGREIMRSAGEVKRLQEQCAMNQKPILVLLGKNETEERIVHPQTEEEKFYWGKK